MSALRTNGWVIAVTPPEWRRWLLTDTPVSRLQARTGRAYLGWVAFARNPLAMIGLVIILALIAMAIFAPLLTSYSPISGQIASAGERLLPPGDAHWLGTDEQSRDIWSRIVFGSRTSLLIIFMVAITAAPIGVVIGAAAGYVGGWLDTVLMRITDAFLGFPKLVPRHRLRRGPGCRHRERHPRHRHHVLAALCAHRALGDADHPPYRLHLGGADERCVQHAHPVRPYPAHVPALADRARYP